MKKNLFFILISTMFPIRCFTCGSVVGKYEIKYEKMLSEGKTPKEIFDFLNISKYCCKRMFLGNPNVTDKVLLFSDAEDMTLKTKNSVNE